MSPYQAKQPNHNMEVLFNNYSKAKHERLYPILNVDSEVRVLIKKRQIKPRQLIQNGLEKHIK